VTLLLHDDDETRESAALPCLDFVARFSGGTRLAVEAVIFVEPCHTNRLARRRGVVATT
jgi:hypothetical protein